jgi:hypothetical protein
MARFDRKDPREAAILGLLIVGVGHFYLGMWLKGIALILVTVIVTILTSLLVAPFFWVISGVWAYYDAKSYDREAGCPRRSGQSLPEPYSQCSVLPFLITRDAAVKSSAIIFAVCVG